MERHLRKIALALATLYALLAVGVPVYQVHCACSGQTQTTVFFEPIACGDVEPETQLACDKDDHCLSCHDAPSTEQAGCNDTHDCDNGKMHYLFFKTISEPLVVYTNQNHNPKILALLVDSLIGNGLLYRLSYSDLYDTSGDGFFEFAPPLIQSSHKFLSFICQRKVFLA